MNNEKYRTRHWAEVLANCRKVEHGFGKHLWISARPMQVAYRNLMRTTDGNPVGIECKSEKQDKWAFILPDVSGNSPFRIQNFDQDGFSGHSCYKSLEEAAEELVRMGYRVLDQGALDRSSQTLRWATGVKQQEIRLLFDRDLIDFTQMCKRMTAVSQEMLGGVAA